MADHGGNGTNVAFQRYVTTLVLDHIGSAGFALAGSGAIREHGITDRLTNDVDLFTTTTTGQEAFAASVAEAEDALAGHGYRVTRMRTTPEFARLLVEASEAADDNVVEVDFGIDWRTNPPTVRDRAGPRAARRGRKQGRGRLLPRRGPGLSRPRRDPQVRAFHRPRPTVLAKEHDPGFELGHFIDQLHRVNRIRPGRTSDYGVDADQLDQIKTRITAWADELDAPAPPPPRPAAPRPPEHRPAPPADQPYPRHHRDTGGPSIGF